jgi:hypothetical protein
MVGSWGARTTCHNNPSVGVIHHLQMELQTFIISREKRREEKPEEDKSVSFSL